MGLCSPNDAVGAISSTASLRRRGALINGRSADTAGRWYADLMFLVSVLERSSCEACAYNNVWSIGAVIRNERFIGEMESNLF